MKRKFLSILLTLAMALTLLPVSAMAEGETANVAKVGETEYTTLQDAIDAAKSGATVTLLADVNTPETSYTIRKSLTIDLNGKTITADGYDSVFAIKGEGNHVVINATNGGKVIAVENSGSDGKYAMAVWLAGWQGQHAGDQRRRVQPGNHSYGRPADEYDLHLQGCDHHQRRYVPQRHTEVDAEHQ